MLLNCCIQYASKFGKFSSGHRTGKGQFSFQSQRRAMPKNVQTQAQLHSFHTASKVLLQILQARLQQYMNGELPDVQAGFRKGRGTRDQIANICWIIEKAREFQKHIFCFIDYSKAFDFLSESCSVMLHFCNPMDPWSPARLLCPWNSLGQSTGVGFHFTTNCGKFLKRREYQTTLPASWEICMQVKKQQLEHDMKQWTGSKLENEYVMAVYCNPAYLTFMQSTSCEMPG